MRVHFLLVCPMMLACRDEPITKAYPSADVRYMSGLSDTDGDGALSDSDCDDEDAEVSPGLSETCDEKDNDCDGEVDEEAADAPAWYPDADGDGYGSDVEGVAQTACAQPDAKVDNRDDCDDTEADAWTGAAELCDGVDNDCDGTIDGPLAEDAITFYRDSDGDGWGDPASVMVDCEASEGAVEVEGDCNDLDIEVFPGAVEWCDGVDSNCDGDLSDTGLATFWDTTGLPTDYSALLVGEPTLASSVVLQEEGALQICPGRWYTNLIVEADVYISGVSGNSDEVVLDGLGMASVIRMSTEDLHVSVQDVTITAGYASTSIYMVGAGGGLLCESEGQPSSLDLIGVNVEGNSAEWYGGGLAAVNCTMNVADSTITNNETEYGGGVAALDGTITLVNSVITGNRAIDGGGGLMETSFIDSSSIVLRDSIVSDNTAQLGGAAYLETGRLECIANSETIESGIWGNTDNFGAAGVYLSNDAELSAELCDLAALPSGRDNGHYDVFVESTDFAYSYADNQTFTCTSSRCGDEEVATLGDALSEAATNNRIRGNVFTASADGTIEDFEAWLAPSEENCSVYFYLLSASGASHPVWEVLWSNAISADSSSAGWFSSGSVGVPVEVGRSYATLTAWSCGSGESVVSYGDLNGAVVGDAGVGTTIGSWASAWSAADYSGGTVPAAGALALGATAMSRAYQQINWSH